MVSVRELKRLILSKRFCTSVKGGNVIGAFGSIWWL
jgi:hypothetical protein